MKDFGIMLAWIAGMFVIGELVFLIMLYFSCQWMTLCF